jgi:DNA-binding phage protein
MADPLHIQLRAAVAGLDVPRRLRDAHLSERTYYRVMSGKYAPRLGFLTELARALDLEVHVTPAGLTVAPYARGSVAKPTAMDQE